MELKMIAGIVTPYLVDHIEFKETIEVLTGANVSIAGVSVTDIVAYYYVNHTYFIVGILWLRFCCDMMGMAPSIFYMG